MSEPEATATEEAATEGSTEETIERSPVSTVLARRIVARRLFLAQLALVCTFGFLALASYFYPGVFGAFFFGVVLGALGASISLLRRIAKEGIEQGESPVTEELAGSRITTLMPLLYGALMAGVAYLLFLSGLLSGDGGGGLLTSNFFPHFTDPQVPKDELLSFRHFAEIRPAHVKDFGKVLVWCFLSGYSESFITGILDQMEKRVTGGGASEVPPEEADGRSS